MPARKQPDNKNVDGSGTVETANSPNVFPMLFRVKVDKLPDTRERVNVSLTPIDEVKPDKAMLLPVAPPLHVPTLAPAEQLLKTKVVDVPMVLPFTVKVPVRLPLFAALQPVTVVELIQKVSTTWINSVTPPAAPVTMEPAGTNPIFPPINHLRDGLVGAPTFAWTA
jgi:hypothetical protein